MKAYKIRLPFEVVSPDGTEDKASLTLEVFAESAQDAGNQFVYIVTGREVDSAPKRSGFFARWFR